MFFAPGLLRELGVGRPAALSLIRVEGESMSPTLAHGDDILVDEDDAAARLRDGIYVLRVGEALIVKRVALTPGGGLSILSDNPQSPGWENVDRASLAVIGRVVWAGRKLR
jgi:phage repressor protein C with HTH and peptisase S24 domain